MFEFLLCSMITILPDYLYRRRVQKKEWGRELTLFSIWYELRWGLSACALLTICILTVVFYYHPSTSNVASAFRTVTILPESGGRVAEVAVQNNQRVEAGQLLFRLDDSLQRAAAETAQRQVEEIDASITVAQSELASADGLVTEAEGALEQARSELRRAEDLVSRNSSVVSQSEVDRLRNQLASREGSLNAAIANKAAVEAKITTLLPAQKASAEAALDQANIALAKTRVYAGVSGTLEQFALQPGDYVSAIMRPAGLLVPDFAGRGRFVAGFEQISTQVLKPGMVAEISCASKPFTVIPMVITQIQDVIATGQVRPTDQLLDSRVRQAPGTITVYMEPLFEGTTDDIPPGSQCLGNAYTSHHAQLASGDADFLTSLVYHTIDTVGVVHAAGLRLRSLFMPFQILVFSGH
ncbi:Inner membrane protein YibH [Hartmannibacter diazotrophicus]|uniref:Inner membrane protein YibH n=1 Tax=Hartmannibacter diazotrophicus TaxID=1482074 RepID=A0A2C9D2N0_9HYPH|nr:HlyD family secretion protein [Hartmannibacter diazotrophicus]SON54483.1 Inner membrane protein YibH [Hartmannibacter diazotrophicus]